MPRRTGALLNFIRPFLAMAMIEQAHHCSSGLTKTFFDLIEEYLTGVTLRSRAAENRTLELGWRDGQTAALTPRRTGVVL